MAFRLPLRVVSKQIARLALKNSFTYKAPISLTNRYFSNSSITLNSKPQVLNVLTSEINLEKEINADKEKPEVIDSFLETTGFKVVENGENRSLAEIVKVTDSEIVHVYFDISQITNIPEPLSNQIDESGQNGEEFDFDNELNEEFANLNLVIEKKADGSAISVEVLFKLDDCSMYVESITPYKDAKLALSESAEAETTRQLTYHGPPFSNLDENLQEVFESYIKDLGINESLGDFIVAYSEHQEGNEYFKWLNSLKTFFN